MIDIKLLRDNFEKNKELLMRRGVSASDIDKVVDLDSKKRLLTTEVQALREDKNKISSIRPYNIERAKEIKIELKDKEAQLKEVESDFDKIYLIFPNIPFEDVPVGKEEKDNKIIEKIGKIPKFKFKAKDHTELAGDDVDLKRAAKTSGARFVILKNDIAKLEFAIMNMVLDLLDKNNFELVIPPTLITSDAMKGTGHADTKEELEERYYLPKNDLFLVGTSEQSIAPMHSGENLKEPKRYVAFSSCFREEAGSYGKDTKGMFRLHQFDKLEMFVIAKPEDSDKELKFLMEMEKKIMSMLEIPYRSVHLCTGDICRPAACTFDIEGWFPAQEKYRELMSASNCTDFQTRRLKIKINNELAHTLNATAVAMPRMIIALLENHQQKDGRVLIPKALRKYLGKKLIF